MLDMMCLHQKGPCHSHTVNWEILTLFFNILRFKVMFDPVVDIMSDNSLPTMEEGDGGNLFLPVSPVI